MEGHKYRERSKKLAEELADEHMVTSECYHGSQESGCFKSLIINTFKHSQEI